MSLSLPIFFLLQHAVEASISLPLRTFSALVVQHTASMTARAHGAATVRTATTVPSRTLRLWPAQVSLPLLSKHSADHMNLNSHTCKEKKKTYSYAETCSVSVQQSTQMCSIAVPQPPSVSL